MRTLETSIVEAKVNTAQFSAIFTFADAHWQNFLSLVDKSNDHHFKKKKNSKERGKFIQKIWYFLAKRDMKKTIPDFRYKTVKKYSTLTYT